MRLAFSSLVALAVAATQVSGRASYRLHNRDTVDVCAQLDALLEVPEEFAGTIPIGLLSVCLCISGIPDFLEINPVAVAAVVVAGVPATTAAITALINTAATHTSCTFPDQAAPSCTSSNLCNFGCKNGFVPSPPLFPTECICPLPFTVCNGVCGVFKACPSGKPKKRELDAQEQRSLCPAGLAACGVYGFNSPDAWECVDTKADLESCGGCTVGFGRNPALGIDCTAIPGVLDVSCKAGLCAVQRCQPGFVVSANGASCVREALAAQKEIPAAAYYGLEHVPLKKKSA